MRHNNKRPIGYDESVPQNNVCEINGPKISIVVPVYNTPKIFLEEMIESVLNQTYKNLQLCILNGGSTDNEVDRIIRRYASKDTRITYSNEITNDGIAKNTNKAIELAKGDYIALLDHDDLLTKDALMECVQVINKFNPDVLYSDEDKVTSNGKRFLQPHYKPDWSPDTLKSYNYVCHFLVIKSDTLKKVGYFREGFDGSQDYDLILRLSNITKSIYHIPKILYHWRINENSTAGNSLNKGYAFQAGKKALECYHENKGISISVSGGSFPGSYNIDYADFSRNDAVTVIVNGRWESQKELENYYYKLCNTTKQNHIDLFLLNMKSENGCDLSQFGFEINAHVINTNNYIKEINRIVRGNDNKFLLFIDSGVEVLNDNWLKLMMQNSQEEDTVIVGPKIIEKNKIYSYGIAIVNRRLINLHRGRIVDSLVILVELELLKMFLL